MTARTATTTPTRITSGVYGVGWAVLALVVGFLFFWRAEAKYGRG